MIGLTWDTGINNGLSASEMYWLRRDPDNRIVVVPDGVWERDMIGPKGQGMRKLRPNQEHIAIKYVLTGEGRIISAENLK